MLSFRQMYVTVITDWWNSRLSSNLIDGRTCLLRSAWDVHVFTTFGVGCTRFYYVRHGVYTFLLRSAWGVHVFTTFGVGVHVFSTFGMGCTRFYYVRRGCTRFYYVRRGCTVFSAFVMGCTRNYYVQHGVYTCLLRSA